MKQIKPSPNEHQWPRWQIHTVEARKRDLIIRISDWTRLREEPAYDVELYIGGVYDWDQSASCTIREHGSKEAAKQAAIQFAQAKIKELV